MKSLVYAAQNKASLEDRPRPEIAAPGDAVVRMTKDEAICGTELHILKGRSGELPAGADPGPRGHRRGRKGRSGRRDVQTRRPGPDLLRDRLREMRVLPETDVFALHFNRRLDTRQHDRRYASGVGPHSLRRHENLYPIPDRRGRRGDGDARSDILPTGFEVRRCSTARSRRAVPWPSSAQAQWDSRRSSRRSSTRLRRSS